MKHMEVITNITGTGTDSIDCWDKAVCGSFYSSNKSKLADK